MAQNVKVAIRVRNVPKWFGTDGKKDSAEYQTPIVQVGKILKSRQLEKLTIHKTRQILQTKSISIL
jgi:hypothetical protein